MTAKLRPKTVAVRMTLTDGQVLDLKLRDLDAARFSMTVTNDTFQTVDEIFRTCHRNNGRGTVSLFAAGEWVRQGRHAKPKAKARRAP